ncbi:mCG148225 [Mus musculus]|nr:mCG148225 [Mus musculus]
MGGNKLAPTGSFFNINNFMIMCSSDLFLVFFLTSCKSSNGLGELMNSKDLLSCQMGYGCFPC